MLTLTPDDSAEFKNLNSDAPSARNPLRPLFGGTSMDNWDATETAQRIAAGDVSAVEVMEATMV